MSGTISGVNASIRGPDLTLEFYQGKTLDFHLVWDDAGTPVPMTGFLARFQARSLGDKVVMDLTTANGGLVINGPAGMITFAMSASDTALLPVGEGLHELEVESPTGKVSRLFSGKFSVIKEVAR